MLYNPNNVTSEAAPVTVDLEIEFGQRICQMLGYKSKNNAPTGWAHICSGGSLANLEALWVAREVQFIPLVVKEFCEKYKVRFEIKTPKMSSSEKINILDVDDKTLLSLKPNEKIFMLTKLIQQLAYGSKSATTHNSGSRLEEAISKVNAHLKVSKFSVKYNGFANVLSNVGLKPVVFIPESAHYSWDKAVSILGYGSNSIRKIPLNSKFRINTNELERMLFSIKDDEYVVAVIGVVGTTEEGAVDPIHEIKFLRDKLEKETNMSFWLHIDSAWGGYIRSLFNDDNYRDLNFINSECESEFRIRLDKMKDDLHNKGKTFTNLDESALKCVQIMDLNEEFIDDSSILSENNNEKKTVNLSWEDLDVIKAFMAFEDADSITVDPHKLGYVPYPAGVIAFKNKNVTQYIAQKASYISESKGDIEKVTVNELNSVGPYIIEGSKPGAAAVACWLSERTIPMNLNNHGKIIRATLLNAKKFNYYISKFNKESKNYFVKNRQKIKRPYKVVPLYDNIDTNIVCFVILPLVWSNKTQAHTMIKDDNLGLKKLNEVNRRIYEHFTINNEKDKKITPHVQKFFLSRTEFDKSQYDYNSISEVFDKLGILKDEYENQSLFVLRATLMNPWYYHSMQEDNVGRKTNYFLEFFQELNRVTLEVLSGTEFE